MSQGTGNFTSQQMSLASGDLIPPVVIFSTRNGFNRFLLRIMLDIVWIWQKLSCGHTTLVYNH